MDAASGALFGPPPASRGRAETYFESVFEHPGSTEHASTVSNQQRRGRHRDPNTASPRFVCGGRPKGDAIRLASRALRLIAKHRRAARRAKRPLQLQGTRRLDDPSGFAERASTPRRPSQCFRFRRRFRSVDLVPGSRGVTTGMPPLPVGRARQELRQFAVGFRLKQLTMDLRRMSNGSRPL